MGCLGFGLLALIHPFLGSPFARKGMPNPAFAIGRSDSDLEPTVAVQVNLVCVHASNMACHSGACTD
jgi:hypothetical protein